MTDTLAGPADLDSDRDPGAYRRSPDRATEAHPNRVGDSPRPDRIVLPSPNRLVLRDHPTRNPRPRATRVGLASARRIARGGPIRGARHRSTQPRYLVPGWPLKALLVGFPLWWVLGLTTFIFPMVAVPMLLELRRRRPWKFPPFFWMWALYLLWTVLSLAMFKASPPGTHTTPTGGRLLSNAVTSVELASITITLLYVGALSVKEVSQQAIAKLDGLAVPHRGRRGLPGRRRPALPVHGRPSSTSLPRHLRARTTTSPRSSIPIAAQVQDVLGGAAGQAGGAVRLHELVGQHAGHPDRVVHRGLGHPGQVVEATAVRRHPGRSRSSRSWSRSTAGSGSGWWPPDCGSELANAGPRPHRGPRLGAPEDSRMAIGLFFLTPAHSLVQSRLNNGKSNSIRSFVAGSVVQRDRALADHRVRRPSTLQRQRPVDRGR